MKDHSAKRRYNERSIPNAKEEQATMQQELRQLDAVAARMRRPEFWRLTAIGLLTGGILGFLLAAAYWGGAWDMLRWIALGCVVAPPVIGIAIASRKKVSPEGAARAVDSHYGLKSRALTLWSYSQTGGLDEAHQFAVQEALPHLKRIDPNEVVPVRIPKTIYVGGLLAVLTVVVAFLPRLEFSGSGDTAQSEEGGQLATDGAEMTSLPELPSVPPKLAVRSLQATTDASPQRVPDTSTLPGGAAEVVSRYFEASSPPEPENSP